jgi:signal transduction histidine kinase
LSKNIIRLHGGTLVVNSVVNEGTSVQVSLPLYEMPQVNVAN